MNGSATNLSPKDAMAVQAALLNGLILRVTGVGSCAVRRAGAALPNGLVAQVTGMYVQPLRESAWRFAGDGIEDLFAAVDRLSVDDLRAISAELALSAGR